MPPLDHPHPSNAQPRLAGLSTCCQAWVAEQARTWSRPRPAVPLRRHDRDASTAPASVVTAPAA